MKRLLVLIMIVALVLSGAVYRFSFTKDASEKKDKSASEINNKDKGKKPDKAETKKPEAKNNDEFNNDDEGKNSNKSATKELISKNLPVNYEKGYVGKKWPSEWKEHPALVEGYKVVQLTSSPGEDSKFYMTTDSYFPDMNVTAFVSNRTGVWNIFYCDMKTGEITQVTDFPEGTKDDGHGYICALKTNEIIYTSGNTLRKVNIRTFEDTLLYEIPEGFKRSNSMTATNDGSVIAFNTINGKKGNVEMSKIILVRTDGSGVDEINKPGQEVSHVVVNSVDRNSLIYNTKADDSKSINFMTIDGSIDKTIISADGIEEGISHPFWSSDGKTIYYLRKGARKSKYYLGAYSVDIGRTVEYEKIQDVDMSVNYNGSLFVGDGTKSQPYLTFWKIEDEKLTGTRIFEHGGSFPGPENRDVHNTFISGTNNVIFNSDTDGNGNVYVLRHH